MASFVQSFNMSQRHGESGTKIQAIEQSIAFKENAVKGTEQNGKMQSSGLLSATSTTDTLPEMSFKPICTMESLPDFESDVDEEDPIADARTSWSDELALRRGH
eukprot:gnl/TRDRNA2_/TRDRNA2_179681_c0_seq1.p2 gnl/TRDRNA2_/TRDRNA2_179681_c0~~gnl/TRDRNA2_/TRDRNA2_179681_c0_seq1.p2  ORF type:complete len:104 (-),score=26.30 gnl/TRDRNA2_/TRDRNA2_179681_c0_seq1:448-759(-)